MHYLVYGREFNAVVAALVAGLRKAGHRVTVQRAELFKTDEAPANADRVVVSGLRGKYGEVKEHFRGLGVPVIVREAPHFRDGDRGGEDDGAAKRQQRLSLDRHSWIPPFECPADRFDALGLAVLPPKRGGRYLLVCGQTERDTQHGLTGAELAAWLADALPAVIEATGLEPRWRPHPLAPDAPKPVANLPSSDPATVPLFEDLEGAGAVLTYNSTAGLTAIRLGIPVYCHGPAVYADVAHVIDRVAIRPPLVEGETAVRALMARVAYTQWTLDEIARGAWVPTIERAIAGADSSPESPAPPVPVAEEAFESVPVDVASVLSVDRAVAVVAQRSVEPFSIRDAVDALEALGLKASRVDVRSELDSLTELGALRVTDPGGRGKARLWKRSAEAVR